MRNLNENSEDKFELKFNDEKFHDVFQLKLQYDFE